MPVITFKRSDLESLLGKYFSSDEELIAALNRLKGEVEGISGDDVTFEVTHDRPDLFSVEGIARALKGLFKVEVGLPKFNIANNGFRLIAEDVPNRPYIMMGIVRDLRLSDEAIRQMIQLQEKLHATYGRDRRKMAIGFYDADKIKQPLTYRLERLDAIRYRPLDSDREMSGSEVIEGTEKGRLYGKYAVYDGKAPVLIDSEGRILVIIPVLGSEDFKVTERTRNVLIDVTATDLRLAKSVLAVLVYNLLERSSSRTVEIVNVNAPWGNTASPLLDSLEFKLSVNFVNDYLGLNLNKGDIINYLLMSRHDVVNYGEELLVKIAPYRFNVLHPVDLVEDIAVAYGYENIPRELPPQPVKGARNRLSTFTDLIRDLMIGLGFQEVLNYMMSNKDAMTKKTMDQRELVEVENPKSELYTVLRDHIWPQLMEVAARNKALVEGVLKIFEVGYVVSPNQESEVGVREDLVLSYLISGPEITLTDGLSVLRSLLTSLGINYSLKPCEYVSGLPERTACIHVGNRDVGFVMEVRPDVITAFDLEHPIVVSEIKLNEIVG
ncbi:phenylalanine--tRNA ligase subunit beta [Vulcanisaeta sp. JCM 16159]|uniref:phenylalanine--tRNA ligase subunit beta n=1 Tax=Vulcanisaeta sp. JCM 16159 TaxID=1295371 RepID=UPI0006CF534D|nr:phenylalanine--tRNA ligase subunit beta [Vulcanisaeta sp. JCM 16159]